MTGSTMQHDEAPTILTLDGAGLTGDVWDHFVRTYWGRRPVLLQNVWPAPLVDADRLFEIFTIAGERRLAWRDPHAPGRKRSRLSFYGDGTNCQVLEDHAALLPTRSDAGFDAYSARLAREHGVREWGAFLNTIHPYAVDLWLAARDMVADLFERVGAPLGRVGIEAFLGSYRSTPFGVHKDQAHIFTCPIVGEKITRLWPYERLAGHLGLGGSERDLETVRNTPFRNVLPEGEPPIVLRAGPRDLTYWPPSYWHVVDGGGEVNGAVTIGIETHAEPLDLVTRIVSRRAPFDRRLAPRPSDGLRTASSRMERITQAAASFADALSGDDWKEHLCDELDRRDSVLMFDDAIEPLEGVELAPDDVVELDPRFPIIARPKPDALACYVSGHRFMLARSAALAKLVEHLNRGGAFVVSRLLQEARGWRDPASTPVDASLDDADVVLVLTKLVTHHALRLRRRSADDADER